MENITLLGIDIAKNIFQLHGTNCFGKPLLRKKLTRAKLFEYIAKLPSCTIVMEACGGAHYLARRFKIFGHEVKLIGPQFVKPFVKTNKNDMNDAEAITEAASRKTMRYVTPKTVEQQQKQTLLKFRDGYIRMRTEVVNRIRGLLLEYGVVITVGIRSVRSNLPFIIEDASNELTPLLRKLIQDAYEELLRLDEKINEYDKMILIQVKANEKCQRLLKVPGVGNIGATILSSLDGEFHSFKRGRDFAAYLGLVPRQNSSGGKHKLLGISKRGNTYIRTILVHGARAALRFAEGKEDKLHQWAFKLKHRIGTNKAIVALANKLARIVWAMMTSGKDYQVA